MARFVAAAATLLAPGGVFFGTCVGREHPGEWDLTTPDGSGRKRFLHSQARSWRWRC